MLNWTPRKHLGDGPRRPGAMGPVALAVTSGGPSPRVLIDSGCRTRVVVTGFAGLDADAMAAHRPALVLCHAISAGFDAMDVACRLSALRYRGRLVVVAGCLPCPAIVPVELASACPALRVEVIAGCAAETSLLRAV